MKTYRVWIHIETDDDGEYEEDTDPMCVLTTESLEETENLREAIIDEFGG